MRNLKLPKSVTIADAEVFSVELTTALEAGTGVRVDSALLEKADLTLLQILAGAHKRAAAAGVRLEVAVPPGGILDQLMGPYGLHAAPVGAALFTDDTWSGLLVD